ncbi:MAG: gliding motility protein GldM [Bacteroidota bacterium]
MAGNKLSPRQKMIGMMYLVLTALLALNVSKEIINAFVTIDDALTTTVSNISGKNSQAYSAFEKQMQTDKSKTEPYYKKAMVVKQLSGDLTQYLSTIKDTLLRTSDGVEQGVKTPTSRELEKKDDYDSPTRIMVGSENDGKGFKASELKGKLNAFKKAMIENLDPADRAKFTKRFDELFNTNDPDPKMVEDGKHTWEMFNFYHNPVVASVALLTKIQTDVKNAESEVLSHLLSSINATDFKFDTLVARVIAPSSYIIQGSEYTAEIFLGAMSSTSDPVVTVTGRGDIPVEGGMGKYKVTGGAEGEQKYGGFIKVKDPVDPSKSKSYPFEGTFTVAKPSASVSADKMNVIYIGVDNPFTVSVPGVAHDKVKVTPSNCTMIPDPKLGKGHFIVKGTTQGEALVKVSADLNGKVLPMGEFKFRIKRIPDPVAKIGGKKEGGIAKSALQAQSAIIPVMENFDFDLFSKVKSFRMSRYGKGRDPIEKASDSGALTSEMKDVISQARAGDKIMFEYIQATMPDGTIRSINPISLTIQ